MFLVRFTAGGVFYLYFLAVIQIAWIFLVKGCETGSLEQEDY